MTFFSSDEAKKWHILCLLISNWYVVKLIAVNARSFTSILGPCNTFPYSCSIISSPSRFSSFCQMFYFVTAATDVIVTDAIVTLLSTLVYLGRSFLPDRLISSQFLICWWISDCPLSQSFYLFWKYQFLPASAVSRRTKSAQTGCSLSRVICMYHFVWFILPTVSSDCTLIGSFS